MSPHNLVFSWPSGPNSFNFSSCVTFYTSDHSHYHPPAYLWLTQIPSEVHCLCLDAPQGNGEIPPHVSETTLPPLIHQVPHSSVALLFSSCRLRITAQICFWCRSRLVIHAAVSSYEKDRFCLQTASHACSYALRWFFSQDNFSYLEENSEHRSAARSSSTVQTWVSAAALCRDPTAAATKYLCSAWGVLQAPANISIDACHNKIQFFFQRQCIFLFLMHFLSIRRGKKVICNARVAH